MKVKRALISVYNKEGIVEFARGLHELGVEIIATEGTAKLLEENEIPVGRVSDVTKFPEILNGRVKTLHPKILGGILALRDEEKHVRELEEHGIKPIDIVVSNLYPFGEVAGKERVKLEEALESIDVGGPNMIRAAAKNFENVIVIVNPKRYEEILKELKREGDVNREKRVALAIEAFKHTAKYDWIIQGFLERQLASLEKFPEVLSLKYRKVQDLIYGENPHQRAALYRVMNPEERGIIDAEQLHGRKLSWTNILDLNAALELVSEFEEPAVAIIKHTSPCGAACGSSIFDAYEKAYASDPKSAFGGIVGANKKIDLDTAKRMSSAHFDCIIAPDFDEDALEVLKQRKVIRLLRIDKPTYARKSVDIVNVGGGLLVQEHDSTDVNVRVVTKVEPTPQQLESLLFAWKVVKYVKSNGIVLAKDKRTVGIGPGQTSRVDAVKIAIERAGEEVKGSVLASDGFFPFRDSIDEAAKAGIVAIIQPGGSIRDKEVIDAANEHGIGMVFTGMRAFKH
jgi:phosphoribosylaminoimidazolecarboxamide formyltransferase/IMP cyclohydrolase